LEKERKEGVLTQSEALLQEGCIRKYFAEDENIFFSKVVRANRIFSFNATSVYYMYILRKLMH
jgi:hypothetical protein